MKDFAPDFSKPKPPAEIKRGGRPGGGGGGGLGGSAPPNNLQTFVPYLFEKTPPRASLVLTKIFDKPVIPFNHLLLVHRCMIQTQFQMYWESAYRIDQEPLACMNKDDELLEYTENPIPKIFASENSADTADKIAVMTQIEYTDFSFCNASIFKMLINLMSTSIRHPNIIISSSSE